MARLHRFSCTACVPGLSSTTEYWGLESPLGPSGLRGVEQAAGFLGYSTRICGSPFLSVSPRVPSHPNHSCPCHAALGSTRYSAPVAPLPDDPGTRYPVPGFPKGGQSVWWAKKGDRRHISHRQQGCLLKNSRPPPSGPNHPSFSAGKKRSVPTLPLQAENPIEFAVTSRPTRFAVAPRLRPDPAYAPVQTVMDHQPGAGIPDQEIGATLWSWSLLLYQPA